MFVSTVDHLPVATMINMVPIKREPSTYLMWHRQVIHMAECFYLMGFLDDSTVAPSPTFTSTCMIGVFQLWLLLFGIKL